MSKEKNSYESEFVIHSQLFPQWANSGPLAFCYQVYNVYDNNPLTN